jgi:hypothetical protein
LPHSPWASPARRLRAEHRPDRIGIITDMSSLYADIDGPAGAEMLKWAVQDFGGKVLNRPIEC